MRRGGSACILIVGTASQVGHDMGTPLQAAQLAVWELRVAERKEESNADDRAEWIEVLHASIDAISHQQGRILDEVKLQLGERLLARPKPCDLARCACARDARSVPTAREGERERERNRFRN